MIKKLNSLLIKLYRIAIMTEIKVAKISEEFKL